MTVEEALERWRKWADDNPNADLHQLYYAVGVIDGLAFANASQDFEPTWSKWLKRFKEK